MQLKLAAIVIALAVAATAVAGGGRGDRTDAAAAPARAAAPGRAANGHLVIKTTPVRPESPTLHRGACDASADASRLCSRPTIGPRG
jgi:hypothetical protein